MPIPPRDLEPVVADGARPLVSVPISPTVGPADVLITGEDWLDAICPFLRAGDGTWRSNSPAREHRCWATAPPSELPVLTQQRLCLVRAHDGCERFAHARELRAASLSRARASGSFAGGSDAQMPRASSAAGQAVAVVVSPLVRRPHTVVAVVGAAVLVLVLVAAVLWASSIGRPDATPPPVAASAVASTPSLAASTGEPSPDVDGFRRYRVRADDTLRTIADRFGITVRQLRAANDLGDPPRLEPGDVLRIPPG